MGKRKISFYTLTQRLYSSSDSYPAQDIFELLTYISKLPKKEKSKTVGSEKFSYLDDVTVQNGIYTGIFRSAKVGYRPPLVDRVTLDERPSPKRRTEGENEKTHFAISSLENQFILVVETNGLGVTINQIISYLQKHYLNFQEARGDEEESMLSYRIMVKENFLEELRALSRVTVGTIYADREILGSDALNYSEQIESVQHEVQIIVKAQRQQSITDAVADFFTGPFAQHKISKIKVLGKNEENHDVEINTEFIHKVEHISINLNEETGVVNSTNLLSSLQEICRGL